MKLPIVSGKEVVNVLIKNGFTIKGWKESHISHIHLIKVNAQKIFHVIVPVHGNKDLNPFVLRSIARQAV